MVCSSFVVRFDDTWLLEYDMVTLCKVRDCHVRITRELIKHFVWFENPQISLESVTTQQYYEKKIIFPLELIWFEDGEKLEMEKFRGHSVFIVNYTEAYSEDNTEDRIEDDSEDNNESDTEDVIKARDVAMSYRNYNETDLTHEYDDIQRKPLKMHFFKEHAAGQAPGVIEK